ncbi:Hypothetical predicted protein [Octopus vulgaris]|uniref:Uncharacterized protein n=1 Tax=Octopus vulgaris TaxID=6645 RepID=A0AA36AQ61_OCTVU|nr:Hypothetical predicted protein [Octopus vulgaris]
MDVDSNNDNDDVDDGGDGGGEEEAEEAEIALRVDIGQDCSGQENKLKEDPDAGLLANPEDGPPDDKKAFFGHPLTAATSAINGDDTQALRAALQHEYMNFSTNYGDDIKEKLFSLCDVNRDGKGFRTRDIFPMEVVDMILENNENGNYCVDPSELFRQDTEKFFPAGNQEELNGNLRLSICNSQVENIRNSLGTTQNPTAVQNPDLGHTIPVDFPKLYAIAGHLSNPAENVPVPLEKTVNGGVNSGSAVAVDRQQQQQQQQQQQPEAENVLPFNPGQSVVQLGCS